MTRVAIFKNQNVVGFMLILFSEACLKQKECEGKEVKGVNEKGGVKDRKEERERGKS